jgi:hypothetical protein
VLGATCAPDRINGRWWADQGLDEIGRGGVERMPTAFKTAQKSIVVVVWNDPLLIENPIPLERPESDHPSGADLPLGWPPRGAAVKAEPRLTRPSRSGASAALTAASPVACLTMWRPVSCILPGSRTSGFYAESVSVVVTRTRAR